jgi:hypothetical protein
VDFFALYLIPTDDWYIIPYAVIGDRDANLHFRPEFRRQKYGEYKEAWHLLRKAAKGPLDIQACCEEAEDEEGVQMNVQSARPQSRVRKMFRGVFRG